MEHTNLKTFMQWLTAMCVMRQPSDPMAFCANLLQEKLKTRGKHDGKNEYDTRLPAFYLKDCYDEAMRNASKTGSIVPPRVEGSDAVTLVAEPATEQAAAPQPPSSNCACEPSTTGEVRECTKFLAMVSIIQALQNGLGVHSLLYNLSMMLPRICDAHKCTTFIVDHDKAELWAVQGEVNIRMPKDKGIAGYVATTGKSVNIEDAYLDSRFNQKVDKETGYRTKAILSVPIVTDAGRVLGVVQLINKGTNGVMTDTFTRRDEEILRNFLSALTPLLENSHLFRKSPTTPTEEMPKAGSLSSSTTRTIDKLGTSTRLEITEGDDEEEDTQSIM